MIPTAFIGMTLTFALGIFLGWITKRPEKPKHWPHGSSCFKQRHEGAYLSEWTPDMAERYRRAEQ